MTSSPGLRGCYVVSLRPVGCHGALRRAAAREGARTLALSPWRLQPRTDPATRTALRTALAADAVVVTSPAAARAAAAMTPLRAQRGQIWYALGAATACALQRAGIAQVNTPARATSEALLALPGLAQTHGCRIGLVTAPDGRDLLAQTLTARGAQLQLAHVYTREHLLPTTAAMSKLTQITTPLWIAISSGQALIHLLGALPVHAQRRLLRGHVCAASERLAALSRELGFGHVVVAASPSPADLVAAMAQANRCK